MIITQEGQNAFPNNIFTNAPAGVEDTYWWHGVDLNVNARLGNGLTIQGGTSSGRGRQEFCGVWDAYPNLRVTPGTSTRSTPATSTRVGHQFPRPRLVYHSAGRRADQHHHPLDARRRRGRRVHGLCLERLLAERELHRAGSVITPILGRPLANNAPNVTLNLVKQDDVYRPRINAVDFRFAKILRFGRTRTTVGVDLFNAFNADTPITVNQNFNPAGDAEHVAHAYRRIEPAVHAVPVHGGLLARLRLRPASMESGLRLARNSVSLPRFAGRAVLTGENLTHYHDFWAVKTASREGSRSGSRDRTITRRGDRKRRAVFFWRRPFVCAAISSLDFRRLLVAAPRRSPRRFAQIEQLLTVLQTKVAGSQFLSRSSHSARRAVLPQSAYSCRIAAPASGRVNRLAALALAGLRVSMPS